MLAVRTFRYSCAGGIQGIAGGRVPGKRPFVIGFHPDCPEIHITAGYPEISNFGKVIVLGLV